ncbi:hypothetical protein R1flu_021871 [Riccia fluitans]|uniref:FAD linked oxidase N-terminal domain-containing protein n=1 Tax=Riccia fluitans TaxID=41844 RepID=A0ABD1ZQL2_9MARC
MWKLLVLGADHSFNGIGDYDEDPISLERMNRIVFSIDHVRSTVTVEAGIKYSNLASLANITVAGAVVTATHGSGSRNGNLMTAVSGMQSVSGRGEVIDVERDKNSYEFEGERGLPRPWDERLSHNFNSEQRRGAAEYLVPRQNAVAALQRIEALKEYLEPVVCEVRTIAADYLWMSPIYEQD